MLQMAVGEGQEGFNHTHHNITASLMHAPPHHHSHPLSRELLVWGAYTLCCLSHHPALPPPLPHTCLLQ